MIKRFCFAVLALSLFSVTALAQTNTGNLTGTVSDASGIIQGATVVITDDKTGKEKTVVTNDAGGFTVSQLDVGTYTVKVTSQGHKTFTATALKIDVGVTYTLNATLEVGNIAESVTVVAGADIINSADAQLNNTVSQRQILELPLNGRNPLSLVLLQPGTSSNGNQNTSINGQRSSFTNITRDGVNVQDNFIRANAVDFLPDRPNVDDTGEFTIVTQNAGAELGYGASQVQLVTPRGSNDFHGAVYEYNRNAKFAANNFFNNFSSVKRPFLNRNQFGGKGSGRIVKDKLFFFGAFEDFILRQSTTVNRTILLPNARTGLFTYRDTLGNVRTINLFASPFTTGIGVTSIDPTIQSRILANLPTAGNNATLGDQLNTTGLTFTRATNTDRKAFTSRIDWILNDKNSINGIVEYKSEYNLRNDVDAQQGNPAATCCYTAVPFGFQPAKTPFVAAAWHWQPSPVFNNELSGGWQRSTPTFGSTFTQPAFYLQIPLVNNPEPAFDAQGRTTNIYSFQDNAVLVHGKHTFRFGGQYQKFTIQPFGPPAFAQSFIPNLVLGGGSTPAYSTGTTGSFNTAAGCITDPNNPQVGLNCASNTQIAAANNLIALLGGLVGSATQTFTVASTSGALQPIPPLRNLEYSAASGYFADQFKMGPHLTLNLGLRYDLFSPIRETHGLLLEPVIGNQDIRTALLNPNGIYNLLGANGRGYNFFNRDMNNLGPVVSFAWSPTFENKFLKMIAPGEGKTVIRGGYRRSYVNDEWTRAADNALLGNAGLTTQVTQNGNFRVSAPPSFTAPVVQVPRTYAQNNALAFNFGTVFAINPNLQVPSTDEFNIGFEREIGWQTAIEVRFVHGQSNTLIRGLDLNQVNIQSNGFLADFNVALNNLNLTTAERNRQLAAGVPLATVNAKVPLSIGPNPLVAGTLPLTVIGQLGGGGLPTNSTIINLVAGGTPADLATTYITNNIAGSSALFLNNPNTGVVDLLTNSAKYRYNALQMEVRRRFSKGLTFQANYTFQRNLTDAPGTAQTNFEPLIDNACPQCEYAVADFDTTHVFNFNTIYELPFGKGKSFLGNAGPWLDRLVGGWQFNSIVRLDSEAPFTITDPRGTLNRAGRSARQTANTNLTPQQVRDLVGVFKTPCGVYYINPSVINLDMAQCQLGLVRPRLAGTTAGVASLGFGQPLFPGQVFFNNAPGQRGNMPINFLHVPWFFNWDASIIKNIRITEKTKLQLRAEAFNVLNQARFINNITAAQFAGTNINSSTFGRANATFPLPRVIQFVGRFEF